MMMEFKITKVKQDSRGETYFEDEWVHLNDYGDIGFLSEGQRVKRLVFRKVVKDYDYDFHSTPALQYIVLLDGAIEIETSLGEKREFHAGEVLLMEDIGGKGHKTKNLKKEVRNSIFVELA